MPLPDDALAPFATLPDDARLWLWALSQPAEPAALAPDLEAFLGRWRHKGVQYAAAWALMGGRILAVAEPTLAAQPSGCAIDGMLRAVGQITTRLGLETLDPSRVLARLEDGLHAFDRGELSDRLAEGTLTADTPLLDLTLMTLGDLRAGKLERPLSATWIGRKFLRPAPTT